MARKYPVHDKAPEAPFKCIVSGLRGPVVDLDKFVPGYGRVYIHTSVIAALAVANGFLLPSQAEQLITEADTESAANLRYHDLIGGFHDGVLDLLADFNAAAAALRPAADAAADPAPEGAGGEPDGADGAPDAPADGADSGGVPEAAGYGFHQPDNSAVL